MDFLDQLSSLGDQRARFAGIDRLISERNFLEKSLDLLSDVIPALGPPLQVTLEERIGDARCRVATRDGETGNPQAVESQCGDRGIELLVHRTQTLHELLMAADLSRQGPTVNDFVHQPALMAVVIAQAQKREKGWPKIGMVAPDCALEASALNARADHSCPAANHVLCVFPVIPRQRRILRSPA